MAAARLKLLIDTNIIIPLEPTSVDDLHVNTDAASEIVKLASETGAQLFIHPAASADLQRDTDACRRAMRAQLLRKYLTLTDPPSDSAISPVIGSPACGTNDWVDHQLLAALRGNAIDFLITEDQKIFKKARVLGIEHRVFTIGAAVAHLNSLFDRAPSPPPAVVSTKAYAINDEDAILETFREDYAPDFDAWLARCKRDQRQTWLVNVHGHHAAFAIVNEETDLSEKIGAKTLKICSFKVSDEHRGFRFGELLLKAIFGYAEVNRYEGIFVTVFPKYDELIALFEDFGFAKIARRTQREELILAKQLSWSPSDALMLDPLSFHVRFGPSAIKTDGTIAHIIPIRPEFAHVLFPETNPSPTLFAGRFPFGNGIRKAYLCNASTKSIRAGDNLFFYQSQHNQGINAIGVVESTLRSRAPEEIARVVGKRTVYTFEEIQELCARGEVLAILFRQARILVPFIPRAELLERGVLKSAPQSITKIGEEGRAWLYERIAM